MPDIKANTVQLHVARQSKENNFEFLVLLRSDYTKVFPNIWQVVTGRIESNETSIQTAIRELYEETGLSPIDFWSIPYIAQFYIPGSDKIGMAPVFGCLVDYFSKVILSDEHKEFKWLGYQECIDYVLVPSHKEGTKFFLDNILTSKHNNIYRLKV